MSIILMSYGITLIWKYSQNILLSIDCQIIHNTVKSTKKNSSSNKTLAKRLIKDINSTKVLLLQ